MGIDFSKRIEKELKHVEQRLELLELAIFANSFNSSGIVHPDNLIFLIIKALLEAWTHKISEKSESDIQQGSALSQKLVFQLCRNNWFEATEGMWNATY